MGRENLIKRKKTAHFVPLAPFMNEERQNGGVFAFFFVSQIQNKNPKNKIFATDYRKHWSTWRLQLCVLFLFFTK